MDNARVNSYDLRDILQFKISDTSPSESFLRRDRWSEIEECQKYFLELNKSPYEFPIIREPIAASWIRSKTYCLPNTPVKRIKNSLVTKLRNDNKALIETTKKIFRDKLFFLDGNSKCRFALVDRNGIPLIVTGFDATSDVYRYDLSEEAVGTNSHTLCLYHNKPIALLGPENYSEFLKDGQLAISFPIYNTEGNAVAALASVYYEDTIFNMEKYGLLSWIVALQHTIAEKIGEELHSATKKYRIHLDTNFLQTVMSMSEDCLMAVNNKGEINYVNQAGRQLLGFNPDQAKGTHYSDLIGNYSQIANVLQGDLAVSSFTASIAGVNGRRSCLIKTSPIIENGNLPEGVIILISELKQQTVNKPNDDNLSALYTFNDIYGDSEEIIKAKQIAKKLAPTFGNILLIGDSGTGKEMFAHSIHNERCSQGPFISINCASIPKNLIESELFGYEGGSFTGAERKGRIGKLEMANNGTLFLDEIGDMPLELQPVLLRALEDKRIMRIGGNKYIPVNFRVIAATNKNLMEQIKNNLFREDLYYRLATFKISIPPLKDRGSDIIKLAQRFLEDQSSELNLPTPKIDPAASEAIVKYNWPGNARQLKNAMFYALNVAENGVIYKHNLPEELSNFTPSYIVPKTIQELEKEGIMAAMHYTNNNIRMAAELLNLGKTTLYRKLREYNISFDYELN